MSKESNAESIDHLGGYFMTIEQSNRFGKAFAEAWEKANKEYDEMVRQATRENG
jgi:hypothetical protein